MALAAGPDVPGFQALSPLGAGPTSTLFSAHSEQMGRWVALTIYDAVGATEGRQGRRFQRAFELTRRLGVHPHAVTVLDHGVTPDRRPYLVTEFYEHGTFDSRVSGDQPLPVDKTLRIGISLAGALETAHRADVIHSGVHPARLLADSDDEPSLADTGLVPLVDPAGHHALLGPTNYHSPPEVLEGDPLSPATDVFSLASTLYTLLTAHPPYWSSDPQDTSAALLLRILRHEVPPLGRPDVPPSLEQALRAALQSDPQRRPATVVALAQSLQAVQQEIGAPVTQPVLLDVAAGLRPITSHEDAGGEAGPGPELGSGIPEPDGTRAPAQEPPPWSGSGPPAAPDLPARWGPSPEPARSSGWPASPPSPDRAPAGGRSPEEPPARRGPPAAPGQVASAAAPAGGHPAAPAAPAGRGDPGGSGPGSAAAPRQGPTRAQQVFVPYPVPEPEPDPYFGPLDVPSPHPDPVDGGAAGSETEARGSGPDAAPGGTAPGWGPPAAPAPPRDPGPAAAIGVSDRPLHERLASNNPWPHASEDDRPGHGPATSTAVAAPPAVPPARGPLPDRDPGEVPAGITGNGGASDGARPARSRGPVTGPISGPVRLVRGPKAMPVIVLGVIVAALMAGATWMVATGSATSEADTGVDETEQQ